jgi:hypothetical protein
LLDLEVVQHAREDELREHELIGGADLARHASLQLNDVILVGEAQSSQHALHALELLLGHDALRALDLLPQQLDLILRFHLLHIAGVALLYDQRKRKHLAFLVAQ